MIRGLTTEYYRQKSKEFTSEIIAMGTVIGFEDWNGYEGGMRLGMGLVCEGGGVLGMVESGTNVRSICVED